MPLREDKRKVNATERNYTEFSKVAYTTAYSITGQRENSEDIAQLVTMRYLLNESKINPEKARNWVITTSKNESYLVLKKEQKNVYTAPESFEDYEQLITESLLSEAAKSKETEILLRELRKRFNEKTCSILEKYFLEGKKLSKLYPGRGQSIKKNTLYQKIYRLRKDARAEYNKNLGMRASKEIVSYKLHSNIISFIKKYKTCLEMRSFDSMSGYFREIDIPDCIPRLNIKKVIDYDVQLLNKDEYEIVVFFLNKQKMMDCFTTTFKVKNNKSLVFKSIPSNEGIQKWHIIDEKAVSDDVNERIDSIDSKGHIKVDFKEFKSIFKNLNEQSYQMVEIRQQNKIHLN